MTQEELEKVAEALDIALSYVEDPFLIKRISKEQHKKNFDKVLKAHLRMSEI